MTELNRPLGSHTVQALFQRCPTHTLTLVLLRQNEDSNSHNLSLYKGCRKSDRVRSPTLVSCQDLSDT